MLFSSPVFCSLRKEKEGDQKKIPFFGNSPRISLDLFHEFEYTNTCLCGKDAHACRCISAERSASLVIIYISEEKGCKRCKNNFKYAGVAQQVERILGKDEGEQGVLPTALRAVGTVRTERKAIAALRVTEGKVDLPVTGGPRTVDQTINFIIMLV